MAATIAVLICAQALLIQVAFGQISGNSVIDNNIFIGNGANAGYGLANPGLKLGSANSGLNLGLANSGINAGLVSSNIGTAAISVAKSSPLIVTTISPIGPSGLAIASENAIQGNLAVSGSLPFLSAVAFEGTLPTAGSGVATCGCGSGQVGIISEGFAQPARGLGGRSVGIGGGVNGLYF